MRTSADRRPWGALTLSALLFVASAEACATADIVTDDPTPQTDGSSPSPVADATTDRAKPPGDTSVPDTLPPPKDSQADTRDVWAPDAATDAGVTPYPGDPFDPAAPKPGDPCPPGTPVNSLLDRRCGKCGVQKAFCEAGNIVGAYSPCLGEKTGADNCVPAARELRACGTCGSQARRCDPACTWIEDRCVGEVLGGCFAGEIKNLEGLCPDPADIRRQACSRTCTPDPPGPCGPQDADDFVVSGTAGALVSGIFNTTSASKLLPRLNASTCPTTISTINTAYHYARIVNPGTDPANVTITNVTPPAQAKLDVLMAVYLGASAAPPLAARAACSGQVFDTPETLTFNVDGGGTAIVYTAAVAAAKTGRLQLDMKTNYFGPEPPPAVDYSVTLSEIPGETVSAAVTFELAQATTRLSVGTCPRTLLTTVAPYKYVRVTNASADDLVVDLSLSTGFNTTLAAYQGLGAPPISTQRGACTGLVNDTCGAAVAGADSCLANMVVPAGESVYLLAQAVSNIVGATTFRATTK